jgi:nicotinamidase-related amidase
MPARNKDLHGNVPDKSPVVLLLIDVINDLEFEGNDSIVRTARQMAKRLAALKQRAKQEGIVAIYVNDNFGKWKSDFRAQVEHCLKKAGCGKMLAQTLHPQNEDYFVLKPKHSGFFSTTLDTVLRYLDTHTLIITGIAGDRCVLFTANDAFLRDYRILVPSDCVVSNTPRDNKNALSLIKRVLGADIRPSGKLRLRELKKFQPKG